MLTFTYLKEKVDRFCYKVKLKRQIFFSLTGLSICAGAFLVYLFPELLNHNLKISEHLVLFLSTWILTGIGAISFWFSLISYDDYNKDMINNLKTELDKHSDEDLGNLFLNLLSAKILQNSHDRNFNASNGLSLTEYYFECKKRVHYNQALLKKYKHHELTKSIQEKIKENQEFFINEITNLICSKKTNPNSYLLNNSQFNQTVLQDLNKKEYILESLQKTMLEFIAEEKEKTQAMESLIDNYDKPILATNNHSKSLSL